MRRRHLWRYCFLSYVDQSRDDLLDKDTVWEAISGARKYSTG